VTSPATRAAPRGSSADKGAAVYPVVSGFFGWRRLVLLSMLVGVLVGSSWGSAPHASAACVTSPDPVSAVRLADTVFIGRVVLVEDFNRVATMDVLEVWKGRDLPAQVVVSGSLSGSAQVSSTDRTYLLGQTYLVVPLGTRAPFLDEACSVTRPFTPSGGNIPGPYQDAAGSALARIAVAAGGEASAATPSGRLNPIALSGLAVLGVALLAMFAKWRKKQRVPVPAAIGNSLAQGTKPQPRKQKNCRNSSRRTNLSPAPAPATPAAPKSKKRQASTRVAVKSSRVKEPESSSRFSRSGLSNLETMRKKTRRIKGRK
jgi:hypothetical protein